MEVGVPEGVADDVRVGVMDVVGDEDEVTEGVAVTEAEGDIEGVIEAEVETEVEGVLEDVLVVEGVAEGVVEDVVEGVADCEGVVVLFWLKLTSG